MNKTRYVSPLVGLDDDGLRGDPAPYTFIEGYLQHVALVGRVSSDSNLSVS